MDDLEFVQKCVKGDRQCWDEFVNKYSRLIYNYIYSVFKVKGSITAEETINDLFQEIFLSLVKDNFKKLRSFKAKEGCSLASWLRQITVNFIIDYIRKLRPTLSIDEENDEDLSLKEILVDSSPSITDTLSHKERLLNLKECIEALGKEDKYFLELHINRGLSLGELKDHFRISRGAVDMRNSRLIERLRDCFRNKGFVLPRDE